MRRYIIGQGAPQSYLCLIYFINLLLRIRCGWLVICLATLSMTGLLPSAHATNLPIINTHSSAHMSLDDEYRFGHIIAGSIRQQLPLWDDLAALKFINDLTQPLISRSQLNKKTTHLFIIRNKNINAFAAPGGIIGVNTGLIMQAGAIDELAAVLAHEVAHLSLRHYVQTQAQEKAQMPFYMGAFLASIWMAGNVSGDIGEAGFYATQSMLQRSQLKYSRIHEREADRIGFELMEQSPFDVNHMQSLLERLQSPFVKESPMWEWARSHPINNERVADISQRILINQPSPKRHGFDLSFELLKIYQTAQLSKTPKLSLDQLKLSFDPLDNNYGTLVSYTQALGNIATGEEKQATQQLQALSIQHPNATLIWYSWMHNLLSQNQTQAVLEQLQSRRLQRRDDSLSLWINALALRQAAQPKASMQVLLTLLETQPTWAIGWRTVAEWSILDQRLQLNHMAQSKWHLLRGEAQLALKQVQYASQQQTDTQAGSLSLQREKALRLINDQAEFN